VLLGVGVLLVAFVVGPLGDPETASLERLEGGLVRVTSPDTAVSIVGPAELQVGVPGRYTAQVAGDRGFVWFAPDGQDHANAPSIVVTPSSAGTATVYVVASGEDTPPVQVELEVVVVDP